jgi:hypothetical protein
MKSNTRVLLALPVLLAACGDGDSTLLVGSWKGMSGTTILNLQVTEEVSQAGTLHLQGVVNSGRLACLENGRLAGMVMDKAVKLSGHGSGRRSGITLVDISGELMGDRITGTLTMSGDNQNDEQCDFENAPIVLTLSK